MSSLETFFSGVEKVRSRLGISDYACWYRGHALGGYKLQPSLFRRLPAPSASEEQNIFAEFVRESPRLINESHDSWEIISIMRHYGCPTRFMDWTDSLHAAIFFSLADEARHEAPCIWVLNPYDLNQKASGRRVIFDKCDEIGVDYYSAISQAKWPYDLPLAMSPRWVTDRVVSQRGFFTFHGNDPRALNELSSGSVKRINIPEDIVAALRKELYRSRTDHRSIYPDLYGLGRYLNLKFSGFYAVE